MDLFAEPVGTLQGEVIVPGDKSISHRAIILGALAEGRTTIRGFLPGKDCQATINAMHQLGVNITHPEPETVIVEGVGLHGLKASSSVIDCGNAGTLMRLLAGVLSAQSFCSQLQGDSSLQTRPMDRIKIPLQQMGAIISGSAKLVMGGNANINGIHYTLPVASAQVKSCLLLAGLYANTPTVLIENTLTRDHTERMLKQFGCSLLINSHQITLNPGKPLVGQQIHVPKDISSAAFFIAGASMVKGAHIYLRQIGVNPRRIGVIKILQQMGADIRLHAMQELNGEPVADIEVFGKNLHGITVAPKWVASAIDEFPIIFIAAAAATGQTVIRGIQELRFKETDRIQVMAEGLKILGVPIEVLPDGIIIQGTFLNGGSVTSRGDHRVAMAFAMASLFTKDPIIIRDCDNIATSFPEFCSVANQIGLSVRIHKED